MRNANDVTQTRRRFRVAAAFCTCVGTAATAAQWDADVGGFATFFDRDGDFVDDGDLAPDGVTITGNLGETLAIPPTTFTTPDGFLASTDGLIRTADGSTNDPYDVALLYAAEFGELRVAGGIGVAPLGSISATATTDLDLFTFLTHVDGGFTGDTIELEATLEVTGSFVWEQETGALPLSSAFSLTFGDQGGSFDRKGVFLSSTGSVVGTQDLADGFTLETETNGDLTRTTLTLNELQLRFGSVWNVPTGDPTAALDTRITVGIEHAFRNLSGAAGSASGTALADFGGNSISLKSVRALSPDVEVAFVPEPVAATATLLGLAASARRRRR